MSRQLPNGTIVSIIFCTLTFVCFLISKKHPSAPTTASQSQDKAPKKEITGNCVLGGIQLSKKEDRTPLPSELLFSKKPIITSDPLTLEDVHVRGRILNLSKNLNLWPPALGQENEAIREFVFDLFDDVQLIGHVERLERHSDDRAVYYGSLTNVRGGDFILAYNEGHVAATFNTPNLGTFQIRPNEDGTVTALELDLSKFPPCEADSLSSPVTGLPDITPAEIRAKAALHNLYAAAPPVGGETYDGTGQQGGDETGLTFTTIDVLIVHTANATTSAGGAVPMGAILDMAFARANSVLINSKIGLRLRMVRREEVVYTDPDPEANLTLDLNAVTNATGTLTNVPTWRNESGADLVALIYNGSGGLGWIYNGTAATGFIVSGINGIESTLIHEIGHNLGCLHNRENNTTTPPPYNYGYGWRFTPIGSSQLRTIMAYSDPLSPSGVVPYFSDPDITYMGTPTGVPIGQPNQSNNAEVIRQTKATVAAYRAANGNSPPTVTFQSPSHSDPFKALDSVNLTVTASDSDGTIQDVRFYRMMPDGDLNFSNTSSTSLGADTDLPYSKTELSVPAGFWTYAVVARDNNGSISTDTVSLTVAPHYRDSNLPMPAGKTRVSLEDMNEAGRLVGFGFNSTDNLNTIITTTQAAYWENGAITALNPLAGDTGAKALAVGQNGIIYGESISGAGARRAVQWNNSTSPTDISGYIANYTAVSAMGVDYENKIYLSDFDEYYRRHNSPGSSTVPSSPNVRWQKVANTGLFATGIDYDFVNNAWRALRWNNVITQLPPVTGNSFLGDPFLSSWGRAVNRSGAVFGVSSPDKLSFNTGTTRLTFWAASSATPVNLGNLGADGGMAYDLNDWNHAVGSAFHPIDDDLAVIWKGQGTLTKLSDLVLPKSGLKREARLINNRGQIAGTGFLGSNQFIFYLDPIPGLDHRYWIANHFNPAESENTTLTNDNATPGGDGIPNIVKRAFGLNPRIAATPADRAKLPIGSIKVDGHYHFSFRRLRTPRDVTYIPQASYTLESSSWNSNLLQYVDTTYIDNNYEEVEYRTTAPISGQAKAFIRLQLSR